MITEISQSSHTQDLRYRFLQRTIAKQIYKCEASSYIDNAMKSETWIIREILSNLVRYNLSTLIAHVISREPDFITYGNTSIEAAGNFSKYLKFWWTME